MRGLRLLIVDDDQLFTAAAADYLAADGIEVQRAHDLANARRLGLDHFDVVILDNHLPDGHGLELVETLGEGPDRPRILVLTANPGFANAVEALRKGIDDYLTKPIELEHLRHMVLRGARTRSLERFTEAAKRQRDDPGTFFFGRAMAAQEAFVEQTARSASPTLLTGETGSGKTLLASLYHARSGRQGPFLKLNCGALPSTLVEAELFGVERGAFTGAMPRSGLFELAHNGTLFLDEIAELEPAAQSKLLGVLDDGKVRRLGSSHERRIDVRVIAATHVDLEQAIAAKQFRRDLYFRLSVLSLEVPPLRQRLVDLEALTELLLARAGKQKMALAPGELERLAAYPWPGNVRELRNVLDRACLLQPLLALRPSALLLGDAAAGRAQGANSPAIPRPAEAEPEAPQTLAEVERRHILHSLERNGGHRQKTAQALGIGLATLRRKLLEFGADDARDP
jgi:DNA-binding NtrC family response regulator